MGRFIGDMLCFSAAWMLMFRLWKGVDMGWMLSRGVRGLGVSCWDRDFSGPWILYKGRLISENLDVGNVKNGGMA